MSSQKFTLTTKYHTNFFEIEKRHPWDLGKISLKEKEWLRPGVIDEPSHLYNEIQIQAEITNVMKGKKTSKD